MNRQSNKVYATLGYLTPSESKRLIRYLESPYFNQSKVIAALCERFLALHERGESGFDREVIWDALFPGTAYEDVNFRKYCSDLLKLVEDFLVQENLSQAPVRKSLDLLEVVSRRKIEPLLSSALRQSKSALERQPYRSAGYFLEAFQMEKHYYKLMEFDLKLEMRANLEEISNNLDIFYWIEKLKLYTAVVSERKTRNFQYQLRFVEEMLAYLQDFPMEDAPELAVYYYSFLMLYEEEEVTHYRNLRRLLDQYANAMPRKDMVELFDSALHYCVGKINRGDRDFLQEYFDLFEEGLDKAIFVVGGELASWRFNNAVGAALGLGRIDWAENFVKKYKNALPAGARENTYAFNLARVYRFQGKFKEVLELLRDLEYEDIGYNLLAKSMVMMTYYDLDEYDALESFIESFRVFLNRHKNIATQRRRSYLNYIRYVRRLTRLLSNDKAAIQALYEEVDRNRATIANHSWVLEKLTELR